MDGLADERWYVFDNGGVIGPYPRAGLCADPARDDATRVCREGTERWLTLGELRREPRPPAADRESGPATGAAGSPPAAAPPAHHVHPGTYILATGTAASPGGEPVGWESAGGWFAFRAYLATIRAFVTAPRQALEWLAGHGSTGAALTFAGLTSLLSLLTTGWIFAGALWAATLVLVGLKLAFWGAVGTLLLPDRRLRRLLLLLAYVLPFYFWCIPLFAATFFFFWLGLPFVFLVWPLILEFAAVRAATRSGGPAGAADPGPAPALVAVLVSMAAFAGLAYGLLYLACQFIPTHF